MTPNLLTLNPEHLQDQSVDDGVEEAQERESGKRKEVGGQGFE